jgi:inhibitor of KinA sporulation pathway (predicted exonuclease)
MKEALRFMSLPLEGRHHRGIDDARNIARPAMWILPRMARDIGPGLHA